MAQCVRGQEAESKLNLMGGGGEGGWNCAVAALSKCFCKVRDQPNTFTESSNRLLNPEIVRRIGLRIVQSFIQSLLVSSNNVSNRSSSRRISLPIVIRIFKLVGHKHVMFKMNALVDLVDDAMGDFEDHSNLSLGRV